MASETTGVAVWTWPDGLTERRPLLELVADWAALLAGDAAETAYQRLRVGERTGRPLADGALIDRLEAVLERRIHRQMPGPKPAGNRTAE